MDHRTQPGGAMRYCVRATAGDQELPQHASSSDGCEALHNGTSPCVHVRLADRVLNVRSPPFLEKPHQRGLRL